MTQQDDVEQLLRTIAPLTLEIARGGQQQADQLRSIAWGRRNLSRTASANQVSGTARRRIVCDELVERCEEFQGRLAVASTDSQHNQGQYFFRSLEPALMLTVRREPHEEDDQPAALQLQFAGMRNLVALAREVTVYLEIPPHGKEPCFEIATRGQETIMHRLCDLIDPVDETGIASTGSVPGPRSSPPAPAVRPKRTPGESAETGDDGRG